MHCKLLQKVLWFTGLSGSGKSTLSKQIIDHLKKKNFKCFNLDGDLFRLNKRYKNNFSRLSIKRNNYLIIDKIKNIRRNYDFIIVSVISPLKTTRIKAKKFFGKDYIEIFVDCSLKELIKRDTKGLYKSAIDNKIKDLIGYNSRIKYEKTRFKKIVVNTEFQNIKQSKKKIIKNLFKKFNVRI
mgnify:FL=1